MHRGKKWVYYCDHCKKSGRSASHMSVHEKACTANPDRICRMCKKLGEKQPKLEDMMVVLKNAVIIEGDLPYIVNEEEVLNKLREVSNGCPACMLTALRTRNCCELSSFSYQDEKDKFWASIEENENIYDMY